MPIYTKKGDKGETGMIAPKDKPVRLSKDSLRVNALGTIDELNSFLGVAKAFSSHEWTVETIRSVQINLFTVSSIIAGSDLKFSSVKVKQMEKSIDKWESELPKLTNFMISGGSQAGTLLFYTRALSRHVERQVVALSKEEKVSPTLLKFFNRLSDYLCMFARYVNYKEGFSEEIWVGRK
jgi:cob(I)alamin adenosyltransferase